MAAKTAVRRCYYEVLGVERDADENALKKAYRKYATNATSFYTSNSLLFYLDSR